MFPTELHRERERPTPRHASRGMRGEGPQSLALEADSVGRTAPRTSEGPMRSFLLLGRSEGTRMRRGRGSRARLCTS